MTSPGGLRPWTPPLVADIPPTPTGALIDRLGSDGVMRRYPALCRQSPGWRAALAFVHRKHASCPRSLLVDEEVAAEVDSLSPLMSVEVGEGTTISDFGYVRRHHATLRWDLDRLAEGERWPHPGHVTPAIYSHQLAEDVIEPLRIRAASGHEYEMGTMMRAGKRDGKLHLIVEDFHIDEATSTYLRAFSAAAGTNGDALVLEHPCAQDIDTRLRERLGELPRVKSRFLHLVAVPRSLGYRVIHVDGSVMEWTARHLRHRLHDGRANPDSSRESYRKAWRADFDGEIDSCPPLLTSNHTGIYALATGYLRRLP